MYLTEDSYLELTKNFQNSESTENPTRKWAKGPFTEHMDGREHTKRQAAPRSERQTQRQAAAKHCFTSVSKARIKMMGVPRQRFLRRGALAATGLSPFPAWGSQVPQAARRSQSKTNKTREARSHMRCPA